MFYLGTKICFVQVKKYQTRKHVLCIVNISKNFEFSFFKYQKYFKVFDYIGT